MHMLRVCKTDVHAEHARKELMRMVSSAYASVPDPHAQRAHKGWSMCVRNSIFSVKVPKTAKIKKITIDGEKLYQKLHKKFF
jgi:hypothetical protein